MTMFYSEQDDFQLKFNNNPRDLSKICSLVSNDSVHAAAPYNGCTILDFASAEAPDCSVTGQEGFLCSNSDLLPRLKEQSFFYDWNKKFPNNKFYHNRGLFIPNVNFVQGFQANVIAVPAPMYDYNNSNYNYLKSRIHFILDIAQKQRVEILILGAFGCGGCGQNPYLVSEIFKQALAYMSTENEFKKVIFAIPFTLRDTNFMGFWEE